MSSVMGCRRYGEGVLTIDTAGGGCGEMVVIIIDQWCWPPCHGDGHREWSCLYTPWTWKIFGVL